MKTRIAGTLGIVLLVVGTSSALLGQEKAVPATAANSQKAEPATATADGKASKKPVKKKKKKRTPQTPVEQEPYKVLLNVTVPGHARLHPEAREKIGQGIQDLVARTWGAMWTTTLSVNDWINTGSMIDHLQPETVSNRVGMKYDKVMFIAVDPATFALTVREWDYRSNTLSVPAYGTAHNVRAVPNQVVKLLLEVFQPVLVWRRTDKFDKSYVEVTLKAGKYPAPDPLAVQVKKDDVLTPYIRQFDKKEPEKVIKIQDQLLTYLRVQDIDREIVGGTVISGVLSMFGKNARRAEQFALRRRPRFKSTKLQLVLRTRRDKPLLCHRVNVVAKLKYRDEELEPPVDLISDRYGKVEIPVGKYPTYWIYVYSGKLLLARVPYAPGLFAEHTVDMPDDSVRLLVEGEVDLLKGRLINRVARGAVHMSAALAYARKGDGERVKAEVALLDDLPKKQEYLDQIIEFKNPAIAKAERARNRVSKSRIQRVCGEITNVLNNFFTEDKMDNFKRRLNDVYAESPGEDE